MCMQEHLQTGKHIWGEQGSPGPAALPVQAAYNMGPLPDLGMLLADLGDMNLTNVNSISIGDQ